MRVGPTGESEVTGETSGTVPPVSYPQPPASVTGAGTRQPSTPLAQDTSGSAPLSNDLPSVPSLESGTVAAQVSAVGGGDSAGGSTLVASASAPAGGSTSAGKAKEAASKCRSFI